MGRKNNSDPLVGIWIVLVLVLIIGGAYLFFTTLYDGSTWSNLMVLTGIAGIIGMAIAIRSNK